MQSVLGKTVHLPTEMSSVEMKEVAGGDWNACVESAIKYRPPSIIGRARALTLAATKIANDRWVNVG